MTTLWLDFETALIQPGLQAPPIVCASFAIDDGPAQLMHIRDARLGRLLTEALRDSTVKIAAHSAQFEVLVMLAHREDWRPLVFAKLAAGGISCTLIREKLLRIAEGDPREGFGLNDCLAYHELGIQLDKESPWRVRYMTLWNVPVDQWPQEARDYALGDVAVRDVWKAQAKRGDFYGDEPRQVEAAVALALSSAWGLRTDPDAAKKLYDATVAEIEQDKRVLEDAGLLKGPADKPVKNKKLAEERLVAAYAKLGKEPPRRDVTEKAAAAGATVGNLALDEAACLWSKDPVLEAYTRFSQANTLLSKVKRLQFPLIQPSYNILVESGRTSCRQGEDPKPGQPWSAYGMQVQNLPRAEGARECFVADPGCAIVSIDVNQHELRVWGQVCIDLLGYSDMAEVLRDPARDPHVEMGAAVYGLSVKEAYALKSTDKQKFKDLRQIAKALNFGAFGGLGAARFCEFASGTYGIDLSEERAKELIQLWKRTWREAGAYLDYISDMLGKRGARTVVTQLRSGRRRGNVGYCDAANGFVQGLASDGAKSAVIAVTREMYANPKSPIYGCRMMAYVHDEIVTSIPLAGLHDKAFYARDVFCSGLQPWTPDVPITAEPAACLHWSKKYGSDPTFDDNGKLIPGEWAK